MCTHLQLQRVSDLLEGAIVLLPLLPSGTLTERGRQVLHVGVVHVPRTVHVIRLGDEDGFEDPFRMYNS